MHTRALLMRHQRTSKNNGVRNPFVEAKAGGAKRNMEESMRISGGRNGSFVSALRIDPVSRGLGGD